MMNHTDCDHPATPQARAKCRRAHGHTPDGKSAKGAPRARAAKKRGPDPDDRPADKGECCTNCQLRRKWYSGVDLISKREVELCKKCGYLLDWRKAVRLLVDEVDDEWIAKQQRSA